MEQPVWGWEGQRRRVEGRDECGEFLLSWLVRGCEDREGRGGLVERGSKKTGI